MRLYKLRFLYDIGWTHIYSIVFVYIKFQIYSIVFVELIDVVEYTGDGGVSHSDDAIEYINRPHRIYWQIFWQDN